MNTSISPQSSSIMAANPQPSSLNNGQSSQTGLSGNSNSSLFVPQNDSANFDACEEPSPQTQNEVEISMRNSSYQDHLPSGWMCAFSILAVVSAVAVAAVVPGGGAAIAAISTGANFFPLMSAQGNLYAIIKHGEEEQETAESFGAAPWVNPLYAGHEYIQEQQQDHLEDLLE